MVAEDVRRIDVYQSIPSSLPKEEAVRIDEPARIDARTHEHKIEFLAAYSVKTRGSV